MLRLDLFLVGRLKELTVLTHHSPIGEVEEESPCLHYGKTSIFPKSTLPNLDPYLYKVQTLEIRSSSPFSSTLAQTFIAPFFVSFEEMAVLFSLIYSVTWAMKIQRDGAIRSICKLREFVVFFLVSLLSDYAVAQTGPAPKASIPQSGPTINKNMAVVLMVLVCFFFSVIGFFSVYTRRCSQQLPIIGDYDFAVVHDHNYNHSTGVARGLDEAILETFPTFSYSAVKEFKNSLDCAVCLNAFEEDDLLRLIPKCSHVFHSGCIDAWLATHSTCPVCRANLLHKPSEINQTLPPLLEHEVRLNESVQGSESNQPERQISIRIAEEPHDRDDQAIAPPSRSTEWVIGGVSQRNNSTGQLPEKDERFTLRLPEDVQNHIVNSDVGRSRRFPTLPRERSQREGHREESDEVRRARSRQREYTPESEGLACKL